MARLFAYLSIFIYLLFLLQFTFVLYVLFLTPLFVNSFVFYSFINYRAITFQRNLIYINRLPPILYFTDFHNLVSLFHVQSTHHNGVLCGVMSLKRDQCPFAFETQAPSPPPPPPRHPHYLISLRDKLVPVHHRVYAYGA